MRLLHQPVQVAVAVAMTVLVEAVDEPSAVAVGFGALVAERKLQQMAHALRLAQRLFLQPNHLLGIIQPQAKTMRTLRILPGSNSR
jgi:glycogen synthase